jgi:glycerol dehydrogenase-like iron-containing ADH family enzyme
MTPRQLTILNRILVRHLSSLLQYIPQAQPWVPPEQTAIMEQLEKLIEEERESCKVLSDAIIEAKGVLAPVRFSPAFGSSHYMALERYLHWLVPYYQWMLSEDEKDLAMLDDESARQAAKPVVEICRKHLKDLERLAEEASRSPAAATVR